MIRDALAIGPHAKARGEAVVIYWRWHPAVSRRPRSSRGLCGNYRRP